MTYTLRDPVPSVTPLTNVCLGRATIQNKYIWKDASGYSHILCSVGGSEHGDGSGHDEGIKSYLHYINTHTGVSSLTEGAWGTGGRHTVYDINSGKLYFWGDYAQPGCFVEFDPAANGGAGAATYIKYSEYYGEGTDGEVWGSGFAICLGLDGKIYGLPQPWNNSYWHCFRYDPAVGAASWTDLGQVMVQGSDGGTAGIFVDTGYIYINLKGVDNLAHLYIKPISGGSWTEFTTWGDAGGDKTSDTLEIRTEATTYLPFVYRTITGGGTAYYYLASGSATLTTTKTNVPASDPIHLPEHCQCWMEDAGGDYHTYAVNVYGTDFDFTQSVPIKGNQESSIVYWGNPATTKSEIAYTTPFYSLPVEAVAPMAGNNIYAFPSYAGAAGYAYSAGTATPLGGVQSTYGSLLVPAAYSPKGVQEIYVCGYPNSVMRYNPAASWTHTIHTHNTSINPYDLDMVNGDVLDYRLFMDYSSNGLIWVGANRAGQGGLNDYGSVQWYDPNDDSAGEMFTAWRSTEPLTKFTSLCAAVNRTKIVVSANDGYLYVIDAATKTVDGSYNLGNAAFIIEVAPDVVLGVTYADNKVFRFQPSTRTILTAPMATGIAGAMFGFDPSSATNRRMCKLELGPDGYVWMFMGNSLYRIHPTTCVFTKVTDTTYAKIKFASNGTDLLLYKINNGLSSSYYPGLLMRTPVRFICGVENVKPYGANAGKIYGVAM